MPDSSTSGFIDVVMPETGVAVTEGTIVALHVSVGDRVRVDDPVADISTDRIDTEIASPATGTVVAILVEVGQTVPVGTPCVRPDPNADSPPAASMEPSAPAAPASLQPQARPAGEPELEEHHDRGGGAVHSPVVERFAADHRIHLKDVVPIGRGGRVRKQDVLDDIAQLESDDQIARTVPLTSMRRAIGNRMRRSLAEAAQVTTWIEVDMGQVEASRRRLGMTALPIICRCTVETLLEDHPALNAWLDGERHTLHDDVNLGVAVSLGADGLIVPVIHGAGSMSACELSQHISKLSARARAGELTPGDVANATFTVTNAGRHGTLMSTPIINRPQIALLDVQGILRRPAVVTTQDGSEAIEPRWIGVLGLTWDHCAIDGDLAGAFLASLKDRVERWSTS